MRHCLFYLDGINNDFEKSHELFRDAFKKGFPWELMKVLSGPPGPVIFTWRHWAEFIGIFQGRQGKGELIEIFGLCRVIVNEKLKIQKLEVSSKYYMVAKVLLNFSYYFSNRILKANIFGGSHFLNIVTLRYL